MAPREWLLGKAEMDPAKVSFARRPGPWREGQGGEALRLSARAWRSFPWPCMAYAGSSEQRNVSEIEGRSRISSGGDWRAGNWPAETIDRNAKRRISEDL